jgi:hypothetical protein
MYVTLLLTTALRCLSSPSWGAGSAKISPIKRLQFLLGAKAAAAAGASYCRYISAHYYLFLLLVVRLGASVSALRRDDCVRS